MDADGINTRKRKATADMAEDPVLSQLDDALVTNKTPDTSMEPQTILGPKQQMMDIVTSILKAQWMMGLMHSLLQIT